MIPINISASPTNDCVVPLDVQFTNTTSGTTPLTYTWDFGDGSTSSAQNPSHTYTTLGVYDVSFSVTDPYGCSSDTVIAGMIDITDVTASFTTSTGNLTVCPDEAFQFINTSGNSSVFWDFGTGATSVEEEPWMMYTSPGTINVTLIAGVGLSCADTLVVPITIQDVNASVAINPSSGYSCQLPANFTLAYSGTTPIAGYEWNIQTSTMPLTPTSSNASVSYDQNGTYDYSLIVTSQYGCKDTVTGQLQVDAITTTINANVFEGCIPLSVSFTHTTHSNEPVADWQWSFGDGGTSTDENPTHTFTTSGTFNVELIVTNDSGCVDTSTFEINTGPHHFPNFDICFLTDPQTVDSCKYCPQDSIAFTNLTTDTLGNPVDPNDTNYEWVWFWGGNQFEPDELLEDYFVSQDTGWQYDLWLVCNYNGCRDTVHLDPDSAQLDSIGLYLMAPLVRALADSMSCDSTYKRWFVADVFEADYWDWDMGDGTQFLNSTEDTIIYTYAARGQYWVKIYAHNDSSSCVFKDSIQITITDILADFTPLTDTICFNTTLFVDGLSSQDADTWDWYIDSTLVASGDTLHIGPFSNLGVIPVHLITTDMYSCTDTAHAEITVTRPVVDFVADTTIGCSPFSITLTSLSTSDMGINSNTWLFGYGVPYQVGDTVNHTFQNQGWYTITLTTTDSAGCTGVLAKTNYIATYKVNAAFTISDPFICLNDSATITSVSSGGAPPHEIQWDFGNGMQITGPISSHAIAFSGSGNFNLTMIVTDTVGCSDTLISSGYIEVQEAIAAFDISTTDTTCYPFRPTITNLSPTGYSPQYIWDFGDGFVAASQTPVHTYSLPGDYWLTYTITTSEGCSDKDSVLIHVGGPFATINVSPDSICKGDEITFFLTDTMNLQTVNWNFGDGYGSNADSTTHVYSFVPPNGEFYVSLIFCSEPSCCLPAEPDTIYVQEVIAGFDILNSETNLPETAHCSPFILDFPNTSYGGTSWYWDLGNGQIYTANTPTDIPYQNPTPVDSVFTITQIISNDLGCTDTLEQNITVWATPEISLSSDTMICLGDTAFLHASGGSVVIWTPNQAISDPNSYDPSASPNASVMYYAAVYDTHGCTNNDSVFVYVQQMPVITHSNDTTIQIGETVNLFAIADQNNMSYVWSPDYELSGTIGSYVFARPLESTTYTIVMVDSMGCFEIVETVYIEVLENYSLDVPTVFTPNGDVSNDKVFVRGWGIKQLLEFSIYNRWGERVYFSDDLYEGWDGTYNGIKQNIDTYTYYVKVQTFGDSILEKKGNITLLR